MKKSLPLIEVVKNLTAPFLLYLLVIIAFWVFAMPMFKSNIMNEKKQQIRSITKVASSLVNHYYERYKIGELSEEDAKQRVLERLDEIRYGAENKDYIWILNTDGTVVLHPYLKKLVGKNIDEIKSPERKTALKQMLNLANDKSDGYLEYKWEYYNNKEKQNKISYISLFEPWNWIVGTGVYTLEAEAYIQNITKYANTSFIIFGIIILGITIVISHNNIKNIRTVYKTNEELSKSNTNLKITLNSIGDGVISTDILGNVTAINPIAENLTGWTYEEAVGKSFAEIFKIINSKTKESLENPVKIVLQKGKIIGLANHTSLISRKGIEYNIADSAAPVVSDSGEVKGVVLVFRDVTEEYKMREKLARYNELLKIATSNLDGIIYIINREMKFTLSKGKKLKSIGLEEDEFVGKSLSEFLKTDDESNPVIQKHKEAFHGNTVRYKYKYADKIFLTTLSPVYNDFDEVDFIVGVGSDITEIEEYERQISESEAKYKLLVENQSDMVVKVSKEGVFEFVSPSYCKTFGKTEEELLGKAYLPLVHPEDRESSDAAFQRVFKPPYRAYLEQRAMTAEGWRWLGWEDTAVFDDNNNVVSIIGLGRDITDAVDMREHLKERNTFIQTVLDNLPIGIALNRMDSGEAFYLNYKFLEIYGWSENDIKDISTFFEKVYPDKDYREKIQNRIMSDIQSGDPAKMHWENIEITASNNEKRIVNAHNIPLFDQNTMVSTVTDITLQKQIEKELIAAKIKAEESDNLKSAFLANMSHEIRTPMNGILGFANLMKQDDVTEEENKEYISIIENSGQRMLELINDIIDLSKIESGQMDLTLSDVNVNTLLKEAYDFFKNEASKNNLDLEYNIALNDDEAFISTDKVKLFAIVNNFIKNAIKYTNEGGIKFGYKIENSDIIFFVKDTGIGIAKDKLDIIFDRFVQEESNISQKYEGAGLGLSISKAYAQMLNGKVWVISEKKKGSEFFFSMPYNKAKSTTKEDAMPSKIPLGFHNLKILAVEDDYSSMKLLDKILMNEAGELIKATNGREAIDIIKQRDDINIILMDIKMPVLNGYETTKEIRKFNQDVIILAQTAFALEGDKAKVLAAGCNDYITKPINKNHLIKILEKYC
jgi:two-component system CheB/CheR fusion protein